MGRYFVEVMCKGYTIIISEEGSGSLAKGAGNF